MNGIRSKRNERRLERRAAKSARLKRFAVATGLGIGASLMLAAPGGAFIGDYTENGFDEIPVTNLDDSGPGSLRAALAESENRGDVVNVVFESSLSGTIELGSPLQAPGWTLVFGPGADRVTIDANGHGRVFDIGHRVNGDGFVVHDLTLTGGTADKGGAIGGETLSFVSAEGMAFEGNEAELGGAIYADREIHAKDSTFSGNRAEVGGALASPAGILPVNSTFSGNHAEESGGAIAAIAENPPWDPVATTTFVMATNSTFSGNSSGSEGGAISSFAEDGERSEAILFSTTISGNEAEVSGGGLGGDFTYGLLNNTVIEGNSAPASPDVDAGRNEVTFKSLFTFIGDTDGTTFDTQITGSDILDGGDAMLNGLADNGGPTKTMEPAAGSPLIDVGWAAGTEGFDQRGEPRGQDDPAVADFDVTGMGQFWSDRAPLSSDIGAFEKPVPEIAEEEADEFRVLGASVDRRRGTAKVKVSVPAAGRVKLAGAGRLKSPSRKVAKGVHVFRAVPIGRLKKKLNRTGRAKVVVKFNFRAEDGGVSSKRRGLPLAKTRPGK